MQLGLIWAMATNRVIGRQGGLPWHLPAEMRWFRKCTLGKPIIVGRKTFESFGRPLPGRMNIVVTDQRDYTATGVTVCRSLDAALAAARLECDRTGADEAMVVGGAEIYRLALPLADRLYVTEVHGEVEGDVWFPAYDLGQFRTVDSQCRDADEKNVFAFTTTVLNRISSRSAPMGMAAG